jgi:alpha-tubulin suppressor-like RCC1 family protein
MQPITPVLRSAPGSCSETPLRRWLAASAKLKRFGSLFRGAMLIALVAVGVATARAETRYVLAPGATLSLTAELTNTEMAVQWYRNGRPIPNARTPQYTNASVTFDDAGVYWALVDGVRCTPPNFVFVTPARTQVLAWGSGNSGQLTLPAAAADPVAVSAGRYCSAVIKRDGTVVVWGREDTGLLPVPAGLTGVVAIAGGGSHWLALRSDGTVVGWGSSYYGQTTIPTGLANVAAIEAGDYHSLALKTDGTVVAWGRNNYGQATVPSGLTNVVAISAGEAHSVALKADGTVVAWGTFDSGLATAVPSGLSNVVAIDAGYYQTIALKRDGTIAVWGNNPFGQLDVPAGLAGVVAVGAGTNFSFALKADGQLVEWGSGLAGNLAHPAWLTNILSLSAGDAAVMALRDASADAAPSISVQPQSRSLGELQNVTFSVTAEGAAPLAYQWRKNGVNLTGETGTSLTLRKVSSADAATYDVVISNHVSSLTSTGAVLTVNPIPVVTLQSAARQVLASGATLTLSATASGTGTLHYQWYRNGRAVNGAQSSTYTVPAVGYGDRGFYRVDVTDDWGTRRSSGAFVLVAPTRTQVRGWGSNGGLRVVPASDPGDVIAVAAGKQHVLGVRRDGSVIGWGSDEKKVTTAIPADLTDAVAIATSDLEGCALRSDGTVVTWGQDSNFSSHLLVPGFVVGLDVDGSYVTTHAYLKNDGTVAVSDNSTGPRSVPSDLLEAVAVVQAAERTTAVLIDGSVRTWAPDYVPALAVPAGLSSVMDVAAGPRHLLARRSDGTVVAWGAAEQIAVPAGLTGVTAIAAGAYHSAAVKADGTVVTWGRNTNGQTTVPADIDKVFAAACSGTEFNGDFTVVLRDASADTVPAIGVQPVGATLIESTPLTLSVAASGPGPLAYQWRKDGTPIGGAVAPVFHRDATPLSDAGSYDVVVSNHIGSVTSSAVSVVVQAVPAITSISPARQLLTPGSALDLAVTATGTGTLTYQWVHNGRVVAGASGATLHVANAGSDANGWYRVLITDQVGTRRSPLMFVRVVPAATRVSVWGRYSQNAQVPYPPAEAANPVAIAAGHFNGAAIRRDATVVTWDYALYTGTPSVGTIAPGVTDVVEIAAGDRRTLAVRSDGTVVQLGEGAANWASFVNSLTDIVMVSAAREHQLALRSDGTVVAWGGNTYGQTMVPAGLRDVVAIACGDAHSLALKSDGTVVAWGSNNYSQRTPPADLASVRAISARGYRSLALCEDGHAVSWGSPAYLNDERVRNGRRDIAAIAAGLKFVVLLRAGNPDAPILQYGDTSDQYLTIPESVGNVVQIDANDFSAFAVIDNTAETAPRILAQPVPIRAASGEHVKFTVERAGAFPFTYQWRKNGTPIPGATAATLWRYEVTTLDEGSYDVVITNSLGSRTSDPATLTVLPAATVNLVSPRRIVARLGEPFEIQASGSGTGTLRWQWLRDGLPVPGATGPTLRIAHTRRTDRGAYVAQVQDDNGTVISSPVFVVVAPRVGRLDGSPTTAVDLTESFAISPEGGLSLLPRAYGISYPQDARDIISVCSCYGRNPYLVLLKSDGTLIGWSSAGGYGQYDIPAGLKDIVAISSESDDSVYRLPHVLALKANGRVVAFGPGSVAASYSVPADLVDAVGIAAAKTYAVAIRRNGDLVDWGYVEKGGRWPDVVDAAYVGQGYKSVVVARRNGQVAYWGGREFDGVPPPTFSTPVWRTYGTSALMVDGTRSSWTMEGYRYPGLSTNVVSVGSGGTLYDAAEPLLEQQPRAAVQGQSSATFAVTASGAGPMTYAWQVALPGSDTWTNVTDGERYEGTQTAQLGVKRAPFSMNGARFRCVITNAAGSITSDPATLTVVRGVGLNGDLDGDGRMEVLFQQVGTHEIGFWPSAGGYNRVGQEGAGYEIAGYGDFDGDGRSEAAWRQSATGALVSWTSSGAVLNLGMQSGSWQVLGVGDFDGDGRSEFLWRHAITTEIATWTSAGAYLHLGIESTGWQVIDVGDFDGDGRSEPLWQEVNTKEIGTWTIAGAYLRIGSEAGDWDELGLGDFDADGRTEAYWRNRVTRQVGTWTRSGTFISLGNETDTSTVIGAGDYDGDTATDLLWRDATTKEVGTWTAAGTYIRFGSEAGDWRVVPRTPTVTTQPAGQWLASGATTTFSATVASSPAASAQWQVSTDGSTWVDVVDGSQYSGARTTRLTITTATRSLNGNRYRCVLRNSVGRAMSAAATLNVSARACVANDLDGDGKTDILWRYTPLQELGIWNSTGFVHLGTEGTGWVVIGVGDFDADGKMDLVWRHTASGQIATWPSGGGYVPLGTESAWQVIRIGDFDGDGRSELLWRHSGTGQLVTWTQAGAYLELGAETDGWRVIGIADFDGDGRQEPAWRNTNTFEIRTTTIAGATIRLGTEGGGWTVTAFGDADGDGQAEPFWRHAATLENVTWTRAGGFVRLGTESSGGWHVVAVGDYDGDGKSEPLWQHESTHEIATWPSGGGYLPLGTESGSWVPRMQ